MLPGLNLLSLDGGGITGLSSLFILREIMDRLQATAGLPSRPHPWEHFDLIAGTGTGAIFAVMLGRLKMSVDEVIEAYCHLMSKTYTGKGLAAPCNSGTLAAERLEQGLKAIIAKATGNADERMMEENPNEAKCKVVIYATPTHSTNASLPCAFRTYPANVHVIPDCPIWKALRASTAHPELFKSVEIEELGEGYQFTDGGHGCNNPTSLLVNEAGALFLGRSIASVISIGVGYAGAIQTPQLGWLGRALPINGFATSKALETLRRIAVDNDRTAKGMGVRFWCESIYYRLSVDQTIQNMEVNEWEKRSEVATRTGAYVQLKDINDRLDELVRAIQERRHYPTTIEVDGRINIHKNSGSVGLKYCLRSTPTFKCRKTHLKKAEQYFGYEAAGQHVFVMHGPGGSGKTQAALKSAEQIAGRFEGVIFVDGSSRGNMEMSLSRFAVSEHIGKTYEDTLRWIGNSTGRWLMLFDNVDDPEIRVQEYFPRNSSYDVLITTQHAAVVELARGKDSECKIDEMEPEEALDLLLETAGLQKSTLGSTENTAGIELIRELVYLPLAIVQCGAFICRMRCSIAEYYAIYLKERHALTRDANTTSSNINVRERAVYTTWALNSKLVDMTSNRLWQLSISLHRNGISEDIFRRAYENLQRYQPAIPPTNFEAEIQREVGESLKLFSRDTNTWSSRSFLSAMGQLVSLSLITFDPANHVYHIHPLIQKWARVAVQQVTPIDSTAFLMALSINHEQHAEHCAFRWAIALHVNELFNLCSTLSSNYLWQFIAVLNETGRRSEMLDIQVLKTRTHILGHHHPDTLESMANLAITYYEQGQLAEAEGLRTYVLAGQAKILGLAHTSASRSLASLALMPRHQHAHGGTSLFSVEKILDPFKKTCEDDHSGMLCIIAQLAVLYHQRGQLAHAHALEEEALIICKHYLGVDHPDTLRTMANLMITYNRLSRLKEAGALKEEILNACERLLDGSECSSMLRTIANLAAVCHKRGQLKDAEELKIAVANASKRVLGILHPNTLQSLMSLAGTYYEQGRFMEAERAQIEALDGRKGLLGNDHPDTLRSMADLAATCYKQGRTEAAESLEAKVLGTWRQLFGENHPDTLSIMDDLVETFYNQDRLEEAEALGVKVLAARRRVFGDGHISTLRSKANLGATYHRQGRLASAQILELSVLAARQRVLGDDHPETLQSMSNLAATYRKQGQLTDSETFELQALSISKRILGDDHPRTLRSMENLAATYREQDRLADAEALQVKLLADRKRALGDNHPDTLQTMTSLSVTYHQQGRLGDAETLEGEMLATRQQLLGAEHPETLQSMSNLAKTYRKQGRLVEGEAMGSEVLAVRKRILGSDHPETLKSMESLAETYQEQGRLGDAKALVVKLIVIRERTLGKSHPETLQSMANLAVTCQKQGRLSQAELLEKKVLVARKRVLGDNHPETLQSMASLAATYQKQGQLTGAETLGAKVLSARRRVLGRDHPDTLQAMASLAATYYRQGRLAEAKSMGSKVLVTRTRVLGEDHFDTLRSKANLAATYHRQGRLGAAEALELSVLVTRKRVLGTDHPETLQAMANLAATYHKQERLANAEMIEVEVLAARKRVLGCDHLDTLQSIANLAATYKKQGRLVDAETLEIEVLSGRTLVLGKEHPSTLRSMANLAATLQKQGRPGDAERLEVEVLTLQQRVLGYNHPDTILSMYNLAWTYETLGLAAKASALKAEADAIVAKR